MVVSSMSNKKIILLGTFGGALVGARRPPRIPSQNLGALPGLF
jgi:hypothetical protein